MDIKNHVLNILQLYEYAMAIGKSLDYKQSCDLFLKLILKRKNLNAAWIIEENDGKLMYTYSIPVGIEITRDIDSEVRHFLKTIDSFKLLKTTDIISEIAPITLEGGTTAIFNLKEQGYLFLYSKKENINTKDLTQLQPVIDKFSISLKACKAFYKQKQLLHSLEIQNQELSDYAHMVSHDLKSPLRSIDTLTAWLKEDYNESFDANGEKTLNLIRTNVEKMDTLINGILEYSTIGKDQIEVYDVDLNNLINNILSICDIPKHISVTKANLPTVKGDKYRLQQLFQNLIGNAIAYNDKQKGTIDIGYKDRDDYWEFYVKDNGIGIEDVYFDKIFKTFQKLESNGDSTGIGLSIVKKIVDLYGGKIWLTSKLKEGTTFYFTLKK